MLHRFLLLERWNLFLYFSFMPESIFLEENNLYHIYNRGNGGLNIFFQERNYEYFLRKYDEYISPFAETYAFCLMPNHFHLLIRIKPYAAFPAMQQIPSFGKMESVMSQQFRRLFISYSMSINKQEERSGSLFQKNFRRKEVDSEEYFTRLVYYIHTQPSHHGFRHIDDRDYPWSSYGRILGGQMASFQKMPSVALMKKEVLDWFGGKEHYQKFHEQAQNLKEIKHLVIE